MNTILVIVFGLTYLAIAFEHFLKISKSASALLGAGILWSLYAVMATDANGVTKELSHSLISTSHIVFFLIGAMAIVEVIDAHHGFEVVTRHIKTHRLVSLLWQLSVVTFFLSAILDNLATTIVMVSVVKKLVRREDDRLFLAGFVVIAANAGGAWSPMGDVTTTMLWIGGQITPRATIETLFFPSLVSLIVPLMVGSWMIRGRQLTAIDSAEKSPSIATELERNIVFFLGLSVLLFVPFFKTLTQLPPFMGVFLGLGLIWFVGDVLHRRKSVLAQEHLGLTAAFSRIDMPSIMFLLGILLSVATLEHTHILSNLSEWINQVIHRQEVVVLLIGLASAIVDNVPLVAASMSMYDKAIYPIDSFFWQFLAYCAGTGGSILVIGSAAGIAAMGIAKINFAWYLRKISGLALLGYLAGASVFLLRAS